MPGWHDMENGQKPEMEKKEIKMENKMAQKWKTPSKIRFFSPFLRHFQLGAVFHLFLLFFHVQLLDIFHATPARHDPNPKSLLKLFLGDNLARQQKLEK